MFISADYVYTFILIPDGILFFLIKDSVSRLCTISDGAEQIRINRTLDMYISQKYLITHNCMTRYYLIKTSLIIRGQFMRRRTSKTQILPLFVSITGPQ